MAFDTDRFGGDLLELCPRDGLSQNLTIFKRVDWVLPIRHHQHRNADRPPLLAIRTGRVFDNALQLERRLLDARALKLQRQAGRYVGKLLAQLLVINRLLEQFLAAFGPMLANQSRDQRKDLYVPRIRRIEPCDVCQCPMILGRSQYGWWFRCVTDGCQGKRDLGREPGRAVELLLKT